jgi:hypothetical protein
MIVMYEHRLHITSPIWAHRAAPYINKDNEKGGRDINLFLRLSVIFRGVLDRGP